jgi:hypothetical protein
MVWTWRERERERENRDLCPERTNRFNENSLKRVEE